MIQNFSATAFVLLVGINIACRAAHASRCDIVHGTPFILSDADEIFVVPKGVWIPKFTHVTGNRHFPLATVLRALDLDDTDVSRERILSVGEGSSPLTEYLRKQGAYAVGLDQWYGASAYPVTATGRELATYVDRNRHHLVAASAMDLPFADRTFARVVSHFDFHHLRDDVQPEDVTTDTPAVHALKEMARVLKQNGRATLTQYGYSIQDRLGLEAHLRSALDSLKFRWTIDEDQITITDLRNGRPLDVPLLRATIIRR